MDKLLEMSAKELSRLEVMQRLSKKQMSQAEAGRILDLSTRQIKRLLRAYRAKGAAGLVSKHRGRKGNNRLSEEVKKRALDLLQTKYKGFGPTLAHEKLVEREKLKLSDESVRQLMIREDLWKPRKAKKVVVHQLRERRACFGELIQIDGSPHDWLEGRGPRLCLIGAIDDASGKVPGSPRRCRWSLRQRSQRAARPDRQAGLSSDSLYFLLRSVLGNGAVHRLENCHNVGASPPIGHPPFSPSDSG